MIKVFQRQLPNSAPAVEDLQDLHRQTGDKRAMPHLLHSPQLLPQLPHLPFTDHRCLRNDHLAHKGSLLPTKTLTKVMVHLTTIVCIVMCMSAAVSEESVNAHPTLHTHVRGCPVTGEKQVSSALVA